MPDMNQREYQSVIMGALLHDEGKLWQMTSRSSPHCEVTMAFIIKDTWFALYKATISGLDKTCFRVVVLLQHW